MSESVRDDYGPKAGRYYALRTVYEFGMGYLAPQARECLWAGPAAA
jgi:hypothetical protein